MTLVRLVPGLVCGLMCHASFAGEVTRFSVAEDGLPQAVRVERGDLIHTGMLFSRDYGTGDFGFADLASRLKKLARSHGATLGDVAKLNVYVYDADSRLIDAVRSGIRSAWSEDARPAVTIVPTALPDKAVRIAADAVIATDGRSKGVRRLGDDAALLPAGRDVLYLSGRAASGELAEATSGTMRELFDVLAHLGSTPADVVQVKAFIKPMAQWEIVAEEIAESFREAPVPPVIYVEWTSASRATEIELIAAAPDKAETDETITYFTPPGDKASPVFSRVARVHADEVIYIGGLTGPQAGSPQQEVRSLFAELKRISTLAGSDLRHFAKATYYVSQDEPSAALNQLRPDYYDPLRPPAASKIAVRSIGVADRGLLIDMVAAPSAR